MLQRRPPTSYQGEFPEALGFISDSQGRMTDLDFFFSNSTPAYLAATGAFRNPDFRWPTIGHWLVREVPEASALLVVGAGVLVWRLRSR